MDLASTATIHVIILAAVLTFGLATWVYFEKRGDPRHVTFAGLLMVVAIWAFSFVLWLIAVESRQADFWLRTLFFVASLLSPLAFISARAYYDAKMPQVPVQVAVLLPNLALFWVAFVTPLLAVTGSAVVSEVGRNVFAAHFIVTSMAVAVYVYRRHETAPTNGTIGMITGTAAFFLSVAVILFFADLTKGSTSLLTGMVVLIVSMFGVAATLIHRRFAVDIRLVGIELFILMALLVIIMNIVVSESVLDFTVRLVILIVLAFVGALSTKNMVQEVHRLREIEDLQAQVMLMNGRLIEADKMKTRFVSFATHQLRAPIGGVRSYLEMLLDSDFGELTEKQKNVVAEVHEAMMRMNETVEMFLNVAKIQMGKLELYKAPAKLDDLAVKVVTEMCPLAVKKGLVLTSDAKKDLPAVHCDSGKVYHVLLNLIDNAIKYTDQGKVAVKVSSEKENVVVRVKDTGGGMTRAEIKALFKQFSRGAEGIKIDPSGSGLGLFLARQIVEAHGGEVFVESPGKGKGSTFGFRLPIKGNDA